MQRHPANPVLSSKDVPFESSFVFNAGVTKYQGRYVMVFRNDVFKKEGDAGSFSHTNLGLAFSEDGVKWKVEPKPCFSLADEDVLRAYDPRLTVVDGRCVMCFAADTRHGIRGGVAETEDFRSFKIHSLSAPDNRNMALFPERIGGRYVRLERPMPVYGRQGKDRFDVWLSESPDLKFWGESSLLLGVESVPFADDKIGPAAPPVKTRKGWLTAFHAVDRDETRGKNGWEAKWTKRYHAGLMLLDLNDPRKILGICKKPLLVPEEPYEREGFRNDVIFPGGMILEDSGEVKIYYGAADSVECLLTADVEELLKLCLEG